MIPCARLLLLRAASFALAATLATASAAAQCPVQNVYFEDFEGGAPGWTTTLDWRIGAAAACGEPCAQGQVGRLELNSGPCLCDKAPPGTVYCRGQLVSPFIALPPLAAGDSLSLDFCADLYMNFGHTGGLSDCHALLIEGCVSGSGSEIHYLGSADFWGGPCSPDITAPPFDLSAYQGQCVELTWIAGEVESAGGRSRFQVDNVSIDAVQGAPTTYCASLPNSSGAAAQIGLEGSTSVAQDQLRLTAHGCPPGKLGLFFFGKNQTQVPFGDGLLCVSGGIQRLSASVIAADGSASQQVDFDAPPAAGKLLPGTIWNFQFWFRDPAAGGASYNLSNGLQTSFCP